MAQSFHFTYVRSNYNSTFAFFQQRNIICDNIQCIRVHYKRTFCRINHFIYYIPCRFIRTKPWSDYYPRRPVCSIFNHINGIIIVIPVNNRLRYKFLQHRSIVVMRYYLHKTAAASVRGLRRKISRTAHSGIPGNDYRPSVCAFIGVCISFRYFIYIFRCKIPGRVKA